MNADLSTSLTLYAQAKKSSKPDQEPPEMEKGELTNASLEDLQGPEQRKIMDVVDKLRRTGLSSILQLPQLVVCGDQSSGKSSLLEALTEIPFPRKENLCTRFATEISLRRDPVVSVSARVTPDKNRPAAEKTALEKFHKSIADFSELPVLIEEATKLMGLSDTDESSSASARAFSRDVLNIEICGPTRPQLTLVDLPGLIHSATKAQSDHDVKLIHSLVQEYIASKRTIILAVVSAKNDYANQVILTKARELDPEGNRVMGIITKPDSLDAGSVNEQLWLDLAQNKDIFLKLGWHIVRNRKETESKATFQERNETEKEFFSTGRYAQLPRDIVGIGALRTRLSKTLSDHLRRELPALRKELEQKLKDTRLQLAQLGDSRATIPEQRAYLMDVAMNAYAIFKSAINGTYDHDFFGDIDQTQPVFGEHNIRRLRAVIQFLNVRFAEDMLSNGRKYILPGEAGKSIDEGEFEWFDLSKQEEYSDDKEGDDDPAPTPKKLSREQAVDWVLKLLIRTRGCELAGSYNPMLIGHLFKDQSTPWERLALKHIGEVAEACRFFVTSVLQEVSSPDIEARLQASRVESALEDALSEAKAELQKLIADKKRHPITYNHYYTTTIQKMRHKRHNDALKKGSKSSVCVQSVGYKSLIDPATLDRQIDSHLESNMDKFAAEEALDGQIAYYKSELKYFIDVVAKQVIERHLISTLPDSVLSPVTIAAMSDEEVSLIAAEPADVTALRRNLEAKEKMLMDGQNTFKRAMGGASK